MFETFQHVVKERSLDRNEAEIDDLGTGQLDP
jgi:hypothetical protein